MTNEFLELHWMCAFTFFMNIALVFYFLTLPPVQMRYQLTLCRKFEIITVLIKIILVNTYTWYSLWNPHTRIWCIYIKMTGKCWYHVWRFKLPSFVTQFCISLSLLVNFWSFKQRGAVSTRCALKHELRCCNYWIEMCAFCLYFETEATVVNWREIKKDTRPLRV